jgi:hypothetical protein
MNNGGQMRQKIIHPVNLQISGVKIIGEMIAIMG